MREPSFHNRLNSYEQRQDSGSGGLTPVGVPVPSFALLGGVATAVLLAGCQSEADQLQARSLYYLTQVQKILETHAGRTDQALAEIDRFLQENGDSIRETNARGRDLLRAMSPEDREEFTRRSLDKARPVRERIETLVRTFPNPPAIVNRLRDLM